MNGTKRKFEKLFEYIDNIIKGRQKIIINEQKCMDHIPVRNKQDCV